MNGNEELITVKQLPKIENNLEKTKQFINDKVAYILSLECCDDTVKEIKKQRAALKKEFQILEERRKEVKSAVLAPYDEFEKAYKDCTSAYTRADEELKKRIDDIENKRKMDIKNKLITYFTEFAESKHIDFLTFEDCGISITLSASMKSLQTKVREYIDRVYSDLELIKIQENKDEIFVEYKKSKNVSKAITSVANRHKAIEEEKQKQEQKQHIQQKEEQAVDKVMGAITTLSAPVEKKAEPIIKMPFTVYGTMEQLREVKTFLINGGYKYE